MNKFFIEIYKENFSYLTESKHGHIQLVKLQVIQLQR